jgi:CubicO group peptidase (beta-lactamase class C family)
MLTIDTPESVGLDAVRWQAALDLLEDWCRSDLAPAIAVCVGRSQTSTGVHAFGRQRLDADSPPLRDDAIFLCASITKPIVAMGALMLVERGLMALGDRVRDYIPEFGRKGKYGITIRHLLTHTSGLPDQLSNNRELREAHAPFSAFVEGAIEAPVEFPAGRAVRYQSMGFALLGEIISRVSGKSYRDFLQDEIFTPLGMHDTSLGAPDEWFNGDPPQAARIAEIRTPTNQTFPESNWNSRYWRSFGSPWGGTLSTPADLSKFAQMMLGEGALGDVRVLGKATVAAATRNQLDPMKDIPEVERRCRPWGLGWRLNWPADSANFGDLLGPRTYGHWGATGTALWIDPDADAFAVILTTQPQEPHGRYLARATNAIAAALL